MGSASTLSRGIAALSLMYRLCHLEGRLRRECRLSRLSSSDGTFEVALSGVRPPEGNWWHLEPAMSSLMLRSVSEDWGAYVEPRLAIVRLDADPRRERYAPEAFWRRLQSFGAVVEGMIMSGVNRVAELRSNDVVNRLVAVDYSGNGGRLDQWYEEGCFSLGPDEVLLVETRLPPGCKGFSLSLTDSLFSTIDWANAQSSLNSHQAEVDTDGVLRVVVAHVDPAVHNWLDTTGQELGVLQCRWMGGGSPETSVRVISTEGLNSALPVTEPRVTAAERARSGKGPRRKLQEDQPPQHHEHRSSPDQLQILRWILRR
jgi:hypothetical protein